MKDQQSYIFVSSFYTAYPVVAGSTSQDMTLVLHARLYGRFTEIKSNCRRKKLQGSNLLGSSFCN